MTARDITARLDAEDGHVPSGIAALLAGAGVVALGIGAAGDWSWLALVGGIGGGVALLAYSVVHHSTIDYSVMARLDRLEGGAAQAPGAPSKEPETV